MDYHSDRFQDFSLMICEDDELVAVLPANKIDDEVFSHQGLTYGGIIIHGDSEIANMEKIIDAVANFLKQKDIKALYIKNLPQFYYNDGIDILEIPLTNKNAEVYRTDKVLAIDYSKPFTIHKTKIKNYRKNHAKGFVIQETDDFSLFWNMVLLPRLKEKHKATPVHNLEEITLLKSRFPNHIRQFNIYLNDDILAGITIFDKGPLVKSQYGATTNKGEKERALEYLFLHLIYKYKGSEKNFFSMGTVTENNELGYNKGLLKQKEELGCAVYSQDFYKLELQ
ncbi:FemAB family protein [Winogradskyella flava]|uniref:FemAB family protein n=1 Tax=Winogradskyella flava TaxID=1884876 RepID=UPI0024925A24|nr:FemAB family protein [Winogradskyella flava]